MPKIKIKNLLLSSQNSELNTWQRYKKVLPEIIKEEDYIELRTVEESVRVTRFEEAVLHIIVDFNFAPAWLVEQWLSKNERLSMRSPREIVTSWINIGLVWIEASVTGEYLRPSYFLFEFFGIKPKNFVNIPFNKLTHTISEEEVVFSILTGQEDSPVYNKFRGILIPRHSPLGINKEAEGSNIIREDEFRSVSIYTDKNIPDLENSEHIIKEEIRNKKSITLELRDFKKFVIVRKTGNTGKIKNDYLFHIPDLIIPLPRKEGKAKSIAVEVELTKKTFNGYRNIMQKYKDNNKFGYLVYLSNNGDITKLIRNAYEEIGGLGDTKLFIFEFVVPSPKLNYKIK